MATFSPLNVGSFEFWETPFEVREKVFAELRATDPISWQGPPDSLLVEPEQRAQAEPHVHPASDTTRVPHPRGRLVSGRLDGFGLGEAAQ